MKRACMSSLRTVIDIVNFSRLSITSVDGNQHLSEVVHSALVGFGSGRIGKPRTHRICWFPEIGTSSL